MMGGRGSGGRRPGAGRKRKDNLLAFTHGSRQRAGDAPAAPVAVVHVDPPPNISAELLEVWNLHAPDALRAGTLTAQSARSFVQLVCLPEVMFDKIAARLAEKGLDYERDTENGVVLAKNPLLTDLQNWHRRIDAGHVKFALTAMGKPVTEIEKPSDPWAKFDSPLGAQV